MSEPRKEYQFDCSQAQPNRFAPGSSWGDFAKPEAIRPDPVLCCLKCGFGKGLTVVGVSDEEQTCAFCPLHSTLFYFRDLRENPVATEVVATPSEGKVMSPGEQDRIMAELMKMNPALRDSSDFDELYRRCHQVYNELDNWEDYVLVELVDAVTFEKKWYWRRKS